MARINKPWRAMALVGVLALAACEPGATVAAPLVDVASATDTAESVVASEAESPGENAVHTVVESGLDSLVAMTGPTDNDGLFGVGCEVDQDEPLPDGDWYGFVMDATSHDLLVDIACVYGPGTDQYEVYAADDKSRWSNYVVINDVVEERSLRLQSGAQGYLASEDWQPREMRELIENFVSPSKDDARGVWLRLENGRVVAVVQPYTKGVASG